MAFIRTEDGTNLFYKDWGKGKPVVFVHGWCINSDSWEYIMNELTGQNLRCIAYDQRGCGRSDQPGSGYDYVTLADDLAVLIARLNLNEVTLVGHSMGCGVITQYLVEYGNAEIERVVLIGTTTPYALKDDTNPNGIDPVHRDQAISAIKNDRPAYVWSLAEGFYDLSNENCAVSAKLTEWTVGITLQASSIAGVEMLKTNINTDQRAELKAIDTPVLLLHGTKDVSCPLELTAEPTRKLLRNCHLKIYDGKPHGMYISEAAMVSADILQFINQQSNETYQHDMAAYGDKQ